MGVFRGIARPDISDDGPKLGTYGPLARARAPPFRFRKTPYRAVRDEPIRAIDHLWPEVIECRLFIFADKSGEFAEPLMETKLECVEFATLGWGSTRGRALARPTTNCSRHTICPKENRILGNGISRHPIITSEEGLSPTIHAYPIVRQYSVSRMF